MADIFAHPSAPQVIFDPPQPASVRDDSPASSATLRLHLAETSAPDGRRQPSRDPVQKRLDMETVAMLADQCGSNELIAVLEIAEVHGLALVLFWLRNIAAIQAGSR